MHRASTRPERVGLCARAQTWPGKGLGGIIIVCGILFLAMPLVVVGNSFTEVWNGRHVVKLQSLTCQLLVENGIALDAKGAATVFACADTTDDGLLDSREFDNFVKNVLKFQLSPADLKDLWKLVDVNGTNSVSYTHLTLPTICSV